MLFRHSYRYLFILLLALYAYLNTVLCNVYYYFNMHVAWYDALLTILAVTLLTWEGNRLIKPYLKRRLLNRGNKIRFLGIFFVVGSFIAVLSACLVVYGIGVFRYRLDSNEIRNPVKLNIIYATLINLFLHLVNAILFFFQEYKKKWKEAEELHLRSEQAQLQLIRNQVNPHFLFNNLNVLSGMVIRENPEANRFIEEFSKVYRYILTNQEKELVPLRKELEVIQPYLFLLNKRFDEGLRVQIHIEEPYLNWHIVPAALQMLIENAIKHNVVSSGKPLNIDIHTNGNQTLVIRNNLQPRIMSEPSTRMGLDNIRKRYELISGQEIRVLKTPESFEVALPLLSLNGDS